RVRLLRRALLLGLWYTSDLLDAYRFQIEAGLDSRELIDVGSRRRHAHVGCPPVGELLLRRLLLLLSGLTRSAEGSRGALRHGDLGHRPALGDLRPLLVRELV